MLPDRRRSRARLGDVQLRDAAGARRGSCGGQAGGAEAVRAGRGGEGLAAAKAINFVGSFAEDGWAGPVDMAKAADYYARAAAGGDFRGCFNHARLLAQAGRIDEALPWLERAGALGNARFVGQVERWLAASGEPRLMSEGVAAVRKGATC